MNTIQLANIMNNGLFKSHRHVINNYEGSQTIQYK